MRQLTKKSMISVVLICICLIYWPVIPVSAVSSAVIGDVVHLSGKGGGYDDMYLFLTGPNLAPGGVRLDSITSPVVSGIDSSFTRAAVRSGDWEYDWDTGRTGGTLDPGTYLVWAVPKPLDRYELSGTAFATISIRLTDPGLTAEISGNSANGAPEEIVEVSTEDAAEEATSITANGSSGDEEITDGMNDGPGETPEALEDGLAQPTAAGSCSCLLIQVTGVVMFLLIIQGLRTKKR